MARMIMNLGPGATDSEWKRAQGLLQASDAAIGHIDTGLFPHRTLGYRGDAPPDNILIDIGLNVFDPKPGDARPVTDLGIGAGGVAAAAEYPDHGVKTLSIILANRPDELIGVAPGARIVPYRVANGPVFVGRAKTNGIGRAIKHAMALPRPFRPNVFSISMGNPGVTGLAEWLRLGIGGSPGMDQETVDAVNRAYEAGIVIVAAGGQVIDRVVYPARFARVIAVGGITSAESHYPPGGYGGDELIDVSAYASNINRAAGFRASDGTIRETHANDPASDENEPSGTSYAAPQVAAAAALWLTLWAPQLRALPEGWMVVESFRAALRSSARKDRVKAYPSRPETIEIRRLDIERLMRTSPPGDGLRKRNAASKHASWL